MADFVRCRPEDDLLEIGTGCGIIPLILFHRKPFRHLWAVEIQSELAVLAAANVIDNSAADRITVIHADARGLSSPPLPARVDVVFSNPPFRAVGKGRLNPDLQRATARHELTLDLGALFDVAQRFIADSGRFFLIHLAEREKEVHAAANSRGFALETIRRVFPFPESARATQVLMAFVPRPVAQTYECPSLVIHSERGTYSAEFGRIVGMTAETGGGDQDTQPEGSGHSFFVE